LRQLHQLSLEAADITLHFLSSQHKKEKKAINKKPRDDRIDNRANRIREHCKPPLNQFRTCYERAADPSNDLEYDVLQTRTPFVPPYIGPDEWMVSDSMHIAITEYAGVLKDGTVSCEDTIDLEELSLKYLTVSHTAALTHTWTTSNL
jgi:hypothetical protein